MREEIAQRVAELEAQFEQWKFTKKLKDDRWLASILKAWKA